MGREEERWGEEGRRRKEEIGGEGEREGEEGRKERGGDPAQLQVWL